MQADTTLTDMINRAFPYPPMGTALDTPDERTRIWRARQALYNTAERMN